MDWTPSKIRDALWEIGTTLEQLAIQHNYKKINDVLYRNWVGAEMIVAEALGTKPEVIWPTRYKTSRVRAIRLTRNSAALKRHHKALREQDEQVLQERKPDDAKTSDAD